MNSRFHVFTFGSYSASNKLLLLFPLSSNLVSFFLFLHLQLSHIILFYTFAILAIIFFLYLLFFLFYILLANSSFLLHVLYPASNLFLSILFLSFPGFWETFPFLRYELLPFTQQLSSHRVLTKLLYGVSLGYQDYHSREKVTSYFVTIGISLTLQTHCSSASLSIYFPQFHLKKKRVQFFSLRYHRIQDIRYKKRYDKGKNMLRQARDKKSKQNPCLLQHLNK